MEIVGAAMEVPAIALGCYRMKAIDVARAEAIISEAMDLGINQFDHADVYGRGSAETTFSVAVKSLGIPRDKMIIQSKVGINKTPIGNTYDESAEHIIEATEGCLKRLNTDYLDFLLLHRPDALIEPEEVAKAFDKLKAEGKVLNFGVSNFSAGQMSLLKKFLNVPICIDQMQLSIGHTLMLDDGIHVNMDVPGAVVRSSPLNYCRLNDIAIQAWSPFQYGFQLGTFLDREKFPELNKVLDRQGEEHGVSSAAIALAWLIRIPAHVQPVVGTMTPARLRDCASGAGVVLSRAEWYEIYLAAGNDLP